MGYLQSLITSPWWTLISTFIGVASGGIITWCVSKKYYIKTSKDMQKQNQALKLVANTMAAFLEKHMSEERTLFIRDEDDNIIGLHHFSSDG